LAEVVLMHRAEFREMARKSYDTDDLIFSHAAQHGLSVERLTQAIESFDNTLDPMDRGIAAHLRGKYGEALASFRQAITVRPDDRELLAWFGRTLHTMAEWSEAEPILRRVLDVASRENGEASPATIVAMKNLALLIEETNRF